MTEENLKLLCVAVVEGAIIDYINPNTKEKDLIAIEKFFSSNNFFLSVALSDMSLLGSEIFSVAQRKRKEEIQNKNKKEKERRRQKWTLRN